MTLPGMTLSHGARPMREGVHFRVWAPLSKKVDVVLYGLAAEEVHPLERDEEGYFSGMVESAGAGTRYKYRLHGGDTFPDPASRFQPEGVHGPSQVVDPTAFRWSDQAWKGVPLEQLVIYELHVGTVTQEGTFDALIGRLDSLRELGITAIELMPVAEFSGSRNWGYDGVDLYSPSHAYGGPDGLRRLIDAAHAANLAVILDVVYNHLGPEGNYVHAVTGGQFFTDRHCTPWGDAVDYTRRPVREFVIENALHWVHEYHVDGLRLDATHAILDPSEPHVLQELAARVRGSVPPDRQLVLIAEDERNESRLVTPAQAGGIGLDGVWADDFHHQLRRLAAGDHEGYYRDYTGTTRDLAATLRSGWFYQGQHSANRGKPRGTPAGDLPPPSFVHCIQNHDQVGNRALGDRLNHNVDLAVFRAASALLLVSPYTPLLWMGQEWAASTPFQYFTDHPEELGKLVTEGRRSEFSAFSAFGDAETRERIPDPQAAETFLRCKLRWEESLEPPHAGVLRLYRELLALRSNAPALRNRDRHCFMAMPLGNGAVALRRDAPDAHSLLLVANFRGPLHVDLTQHAETEDVNWTPALWSEAPRFGGAGAEPALDGSVLELTGPGAILLGSS
ncbi:malto-oligosyltrehalose trehalohydrolase [soil metagenome]